MLSSLFGIDASDMSICTAPEHSQPQGSGSSPYKSAAAVSGSASRLGRGISWNIGPFDTGQCSFTLCCLLRIDV
jgi:hypothetical protein